MEIKFERNGSSKECNSLGDQTSQLGEYFFCSGYFFVITFRALDPKRLYLFHFSQTFSLGLALSQTAFQCRNLRHVASFFHWINNYWVSKLFCHSGVPFDR